MGKKNSTCNTTSLTSHWAKFLLTTVLCLGALHIQAQVSITTLGSPVTQNFNGMGSGATATLPTGFRVSDATSYAGGTTATTQAAGTTGTGVLAVNSGGGTYNFANGVTASSTDRALGFLTSGGFSSPRSIMVAFQNNTGSTITQLSISFDYEKYRSGMRAFGWTFFSGTDGTNWTAQTDGDQAYAADANNMVVNNPPTEIAKSVTITGLSIANGTNYYLRWTFTGVSGSTNGQAIGIDDFSLTANGAPLVAAEALDFDGVNDIVSASLPPVFNNLATNDFTMETWFKAGSPGTEPRRIVLAQQNSTNFTSILLSTSNNVFFYVVLGGTTYSTFAPSLPFNQWAHIAVRWTAATQTVEIFYNGVLQNFAAGGSSSFGPDNAFTLGNGTVLPHYFIGQLDEFRVWDKGLSVTEINSRKDCEITGSLANLVMNYHFNQGNSGANNAAVTTLIDDSGNGYTGTLQNFALNGTTSNWVAPGAVVTGTTCTCTMLTWYRDMDMDGFGNPAMTQMACLQPVGYVADNTDCDDNDPLEKPGQIWYADVDNDNYSSGTTLTQCLRPAGYKVASELTATTGDCNDGNAAINPAATEICDGVDNNCNMMTDEGVQTTYYRDMDGDGFGDPLVTQMACSQPMGYVANNTDCDDNDALEFPGQIWYLDADNDGYSCNMLMINDSCDSTQCTRPGGVWKAASELISITGDCNDSNANINPGVTEIANGIDDNCDGQTDEGAVTYYRDMDNDGYGDPMNTTTGGASPPPGYVADNTDCNDNNAAINPAATEVCDGVDNNCNMMTDEGVQTTYYRDMDGDGFGNPAVTQMACTQPMGYVTNNTDCDDNDALEKPGQVWYADLDNDGYSSGTTLTQCLRPVGYKVAAELTATTGDCNDGNAAINPAATEICDGLDNNCNMMTDEGVQTTYYRDMDGDGFGNPAVTQMACTQPMGYVTNNTDCDDNDALEKPGQVWYADLDNDGYSSGTTLTQCLRPVGYKVAAELTATTGDCNDGNAAINPAATEICDGLDNNCNGEADEPQAIGGAWSSNDVGAGVNGSASVGCSNGSSVYNVSASGFSTSASDKLHLVSQQLCGNGEIIARVLATNNAGWAGITLRESLMPGSKKVALKTQLSSMVRREIRTMTNAPVNMLNFNRPSHVWLRLTRSGSNFVGYTSMDGLIWDFAFSANVTMTGCIYAGIFAESINTNVETTASFDNVSITGGTPGFSANALDFTPSLNGLEVSVYPNPSNGDMTLAVQSETDRSLNLTVVDALGRIVRNIELNEGAVFNYSLDLSKEAAGIYYLRLRSENGEANVQRIVITR